MRVPFALSTMMRSRRFVILTGPTVARPSGKFLHFIPIFILEVWSLHQKSQRDEAKRVITKRRHTHVGGT